MVYPTATVVKTITVTITKQKEKIKVYVVENGHYLWIIRHPGKGVVWERFSPGHRNHGAQLSPTKAQKQVLVLMVIFIGNPLRRDHWRQQRGQGNPLDPDRSLVVGRHCSVKNPRTLRHISNWPLQMLTPTVVWPCCEFCCIIFIRQGLVSLQYLYLEKELFCWKFVSLTGRFRAEKDLWLTSEDCKCKYLCS